MKHTTGFAKPRRLAAPKPRKKVRLDLKRRPAPVPEEESGIQEKSNFWKWVGLVALLHAAIIGIVYFLYETSSTPKPPEQFFSLLPAGDVVKGTPGAQEAHKLGPTTPAPAHHHPSTPPRVASAQTKPVVAKPIVPPPAIKPPDPNSFALDKPKPKPPPKPTPPKVKVDLTLADGPTPAVDKPKPKHHPKKPLIKPTEDPEDPDHEAAANSSSAGLSKEQIAEKLGDKLDEAGVKNAVNPGTSGSADSHANSFADFYAMLHDQVMDEWVVPNLIDNSALNPVVEIHVEKDGRVPTESVRLTQSSGNQAYDESAVTAAKSLGYLHEPLPDGCPPDISITFKPNR